MEKTIRTCLAMDAVISKYELDLGKQKTESPFKQTFGTEYDKTQ